MKDRDMSNEHPQLHSQISEDLAQLKQSGILNYRSEALPTWCPGCGYYGITHGLVQAITSLAIPNQNLLVVSGIGCAGRYPFFMNGYGLHSIHGRAVPIACGAKMVSPELTVIAVGGDGDGFGIGGGHLVHAIRRNIDITYIVFDNGIYGLTKGQASPTTPMGQVSKTTPFGNPDRPLNPLLLGLAYEATFVAAGYAAMPGELAGIFRSAIGHKGFSFVVITTPCVTFDHVNITYQNMRDQWQPVPDTHDVTDLNASMTLASKHRTLYGVLYHVHQPDWHEHQDKIQSAAGFTRSA
jgi:2-oxoglutarate/2-oxoacid ferredoxin oxidoreductase subunit beta